MRFRMLFLLALLTGCGSTPPAPTDHFYRLPAATADASAPVLTENTLQVRPLRGDGLLRERGIVYMDAPTAVELQRYHYHLWNEPPGDLVAHHLAGFLRRTGVAGHVTNSRNIGADWAVEGDLHEFMHVRGEQSGQVVISVTLRLFDATGGKPVLQSIYEETVAVDGADMNAVVTAFGRGLERIYGRFIQEARKAAGV